MPRIQSVQLSAVDLPFRKPFKHAAAERYSSSSLFLRVELDTGAVGFGESLPREYVTGESRDSAFDLLCSSVLPHLVGWEFDGFQEVVTFLEQCNGKAPTDWVAPHIPQTAAWCAVDLALLDAAARADEIPVTFGSQDDSILQPRCSAVVSSEVSLKTLLLIRLGRLRDVKLKLERTTEPAALNRVRKLLGRSCRLRADANMAWDVDEAIREMRTLSEWGITSFEQPIAADNLEGLARIVRECDGLDVMVDESLNDAESLEQLINLKACTAVNVRISKCGGLIAAGHRCQVAQAAGLKIQLGCQVGESSLLSAAQLKLLSAAPPVKFLEGCFGRHLLREDPGSPILQFGYGGRKPAIPSGTGFGITIDEAMLSRYTTRQQLEGHLSS